MSRNLLASALTYLEDNSEVKIAHLVRLELSNSTDASKVYIYVTDYQANITWDNKVYEAGKVTKVGDVRQAQGLTNYKLSIDIAGEFQEELDRALIENKDKSYVGKDIQVLRAYIDTDGSIVPFDETTNGPMQYFIGDITNINVDEGVTNGISKVTWQCAGKFSDFEKVNGRITDDTAHRGLVVDINGDQVGSDGAKKVSHQTDTGFQHANQAIDVVTKYRTTETRYRMKKKFFGLKSKLIEYEVEVEKDLELGVDLAAKYLPKVYGVRKIPGIPVFIDAKKSQPSHVYVVYAFAEGEIDSFLNFYIDGKPLICSSAADSDARVCLGNQANGDTLSAFMAQSAYQEYVDLVRSAPWKFAEAADEGNNHPIDEIYPTEVIDRTIGTTHTIDPNGDNEVVNYFTITNETGTKEITAYHGKSNQNACVELVNIAAADNFVLQADWAARTGRPSSEYWDANCKLLDTAYIVLKFAITEDETQMPEIEAVVSGGLVSTYDALGVETPDQYTLNPVWHALDYMTDPVCGGGLDPTLIDYASFRYVADKLDALTDTYENGWATYWRYIGWKDSPGTNVDGSGHDLQKTTMQCNTLLNTESTVTKNLQALLAQFDATLNILGGKYHLSVEGDDATIADIDISEVLGKVTTKDLSEKNKWNSVQAAIIDPAMGWQTNQVSFFDSTYLDQDNGIKKKGNIGFQHITNYYTAREWAQVQLAKSRYSREITFDTYFKYTYLYPNANITFTYPRFGYAQKTFRIKSMSLKSNGRVGLTLEDYDSSIYQNTKSNDNSGEITPLEPTVSPPSGLEYVKLPDARFSVANTEGVHGILVWDQSTDPNTMRYDVRDWLQESPDYTVPFTQTISDGGTLKPYILITGLLPDSSYTLKVRTIAKDGAGSKYSFVNISTATTEGPVKYTPVTNFKATNAEDGKFNGDTLNMSWDAHTDPGVQQYDIGVWDSTGATELRIDSTASLTYAYTTAMSKADYAGVNAGAVGAYRSFIIKIRATNGLASNDPNFISSEWTDLT